MSKNGRRILKMRRENGITLIALIITIVVMLILVAVSINVLVNSNLIGIAEKATDKYKTAFEEETKGGSITINGKKYESIDEYIYGTVPKLKYVQEGSKTYVYLKGSYYDYIASKKLDEREKLFAEMLGEASIEEAIKNKFNNNREEYEKNIQEDTGLSYEMGLNGILVKRVDKREEYIPYYIENVLKLKTDEEKEKEIIRLIKVIFGENETIENLRKERDEQVSDGICSSATEWLDGNIWYFYTNGGLLKLNLITPNGEEQDLSYIPQNCISEFNITGDNTDYILKNNTIKFTVKNYRGVTSELLVPVNVKIFKIKISDTDIRTYKFIDGQTWNDFIGTSGEIQKEDDIAFKFYGTNRYLLVYYETTGYCVLKDVDNLIVEVLDNKIIPNYEYEIREAPPQ